MTRSRGLDDNNAHPRSRQFIVPVARRTLNKCAARTSHEAAAAPAERGEFIYFFVPKKKKDTSLNGYAAPTRLDRRHTHRDVDYTYCITYIVYYNDAAVQYCHVCTRDDYYDSERCRRKQT